MAGFVENITDLHANRANAYEQYVDAINKFKSSKDSTALKNTLKKLENDLKNWTQQITDVQALLKNESPDGAEKVSGSSFLEGRGAMWTVAVCYVT